MFNINSVVTARPKRSNSTAQWKKALSFLVAMALLIPEIDGAAAVHDIAAYSSTACAGQCNWGSNMSHIDAAAKCQPYAIRSCNFSIPAFFTSLCRVEVYFSNCSTIARGSDGCINNWSCVTRTFNSSSAPKQIRTFRGYYKNWGVPALCATIWPFDEVCTPSFSYNMASGFLLWATDNTQYSFGTNHSVSRGNKEINGRIIGFRYETLLAWDRFSLRVGRCTVVTSNFPDMNIVVGTNNWRSYMMTGNGSQSDSFCPGDTYDIQNMNPSYGSDFVIMSSYGKIKLAPHVNKIRYIRGYTMQLRQQTAYVYGGASFTFTFYITQGDLCNAKQWKLPHSTFPSSLLTGVDSQTVMDRTLENDVEGTSWSGICKMTATLSVVSGPSFITILSSNTLRIQPTLVAHVGTHAQTLRQAQAPIAIQTGSNGRFGLTNCEGDCDADTDCSGTLKCKQLDFASSVTGCTGTSDTNNDYCWQNSSAARVTPVRNTAFTVVIGADCVPKTWAAITNAPTTSTTALITGAAATTFTVTKNLQNDAAGVSWSTTTCGLADVTLTNAPEFVTVDSSTGVISMAPTKVDHVGVHNFQIVRQKSGVTAVDTTAAVVTVHPKCDDKKWLLVTGQPTTDVQMDSSPNVSVPLQMENDSAGKSWHTVCGGVAVVTIAGNPTWVKRTVALDGQSNQLEIRPRMVSHIGQYSFTATQTGGVAPLGGSATVPFTTTIPFKIYMPNFLCARKKWQPIAPPVGVNLSAVTLKDKFTLTVPYKLELDGEKASWSLLCGNSTPSLQTPPDQVKLSVYTVTINPVLIADVGTWNISIWQIGSAITQPKNNIITIKVYCDSAQSSACQQPSFSQSVVNQNKKKGEAWSYTLPTAVDPIGLALDTLVTYSPGSADTWLLYSAGQFSVAADAADEKTGIIEIGIKLKGPGRNSGDDDRVTEYSLTLDVKEGSVAPKVFVPPPVVTCDAACVAAKEAKAEAVRISVTNVIVEEVNQIMEEFGLPPTAPEVTIIVHYIYIYVFRQSETPGTGGGGGDGPPSTPTGGPDPEVPDTFILERHFFTPEGPLLGCTNTSVDEPPAGYRCVSRKYDDVVRRYGEDLVPKDSKPPPPVEETPTPGPSDDPTTSPDTPAPTGPTGGPDTTPTTTESPEDTSTEAVAEKAEAVKKEAATKKYFNLIISKIRESKKEATKLGISLEKYQKKVEVGVVKGVNKFGAGIDKVTSVGEVVLGFSQKIHFLPDMPLPDKRTMQVEYLKYGTDAYFEHQRLNGVDVEVAQKAAKLKKAAKAKRRLSEMNGEETKLDGEEETDKRDIPWGCDNITAENITLKMNFSDPYMVSEKGEFPDILKVSFTKRYFFLSTVKNQPLPDNLSMASGMPKQFSNPQEKVQAENIAATATSVVTTGVLSSIFLQFFLQKVIKKVWPLFNTLQLIFLFLIYSVPLPGNAAMVLNQLKSAMELGIGDLADVKFDASGIKVPEGMGPVDMALYFGLPAIIILSCIGFLLERFFKRFEKAKKCVIGFLNSIFLDGILRAIFCLYLVLCAKSDIEQLSAGRVLDEVDYKQLIVVALTVFMPIAAAVFVNVVSDEKMEEVAFRKTFGSIYLQVDVKKGLAAKMLIPFFFARRLLLVVFLTPSLGLIHMTLQSVASIIMLCYYFVVKPWNDSYQYKLEVFNELFLLFGFTYFTHLFSDFINESWIRFKVGWFFVGILGIYITINIVIVFYVIVKEVIDKVKLRKFNAKQKVVLAQKAIEEQEQKEFSDSFQQLKPEQQMRALQKMPQSQQKKLLGCMSDEQLIEINYGAPTPKTEKELRKAAKEAKAVQEKVWKAKFAAGLKAKISKKAEFDKKAKKAERDEMGIVAGLNMMNSKQSRDNTSMSGTGTSFRKAANNTGLSEHDAMFDKMKTSTRAKSELMKQQVLKSIKKRVARFDEEGNPL